MWVVGLRIWFFVFMFFVRMFSFISFGCRGYWLLIKCIIIVKVFESLVFLLKIIEKLLFVFILDLI